MSDIDEYDAYNISFDPAILPYVTELPRSQESPRGTVQDTPASPKSTYSDEFSRYDLSEFTTEELAALDASISARTLGKGCSMQAREASVDSSRKFSGPDIEIEIEKSADQSTGRQTFPGGLSTDQSPQPGPSTDASNSIESALPSIPLYNEGSHFHRFRRGRGTLAVTDLSAPSWCEVQFEYGLLQERSRKLENRPASFATTTGKVIHVDHKAAKTMDNIAKRGSSVHKALEREIHPEKVPIKVQTDEERWALRVLQMIDSVQSLIEIGKCREMPIFGVLQGQIITGIIDEIERRPVNGSSLISPSSPPENDRKRDRPGASVPATSSKPKAKKARKSPSPSEPSITAFFSPRKGADNHSRPATPETLPSPSPRYQLHVIDTKSRNTPTIPPEEDTLPARLQLMFYHRLLSNVLADPATSTQGLNFDLFWTQLNLSPARQFSKGFLKEAGLENNDVKCLADVSQMWRRAVEMLHVKGADDTLTIIYRTQVRQRKKSDRKGKARSAPTLNGDTTKRSEQHQDELLRNIIAKMVERNPEIRLTPELQERLFRLGTKALGSTSLSVDQAGPSSEPVQAADMQWTAEQTLLDDLQEHPEMKDAVPEPEYPTPPLNDAAPSDADSDSDGVGSAGRSAVIGVKEFTVDNVFLDNYLSSILEFWYGKRSPVGVDVHLTRRCLWCEYRDGCEWREMKAEGTRNRLGEQGHDMN